MSPKDRAKKLLESLEEDKQKVLEFMRGEEPTAEEQAAMWQHLLETSVAVDALVGGGTLH